MFTKNLIKQKCFRGDNNVTEQLSRGQATEWLIAITYLCMSHAIKMHITRIFLFLTTMKTVKKKKNRASCHFYSFYVTLLSP